ncbi:uncharacterized protein LOC130379027 [Gadus chalcogrammus]|uniref:uncharacterized protein LOC130379027 n=1 Tax=Gadus chalcogrammus TaxID=1042646 RepID=UPI0024C3EC71|nr:uncharacterized protein LOC130379027 [Gadus chalcogrammus]
MEHFHLDDVTATPDGLVPDHIQQGSAEQKRTWLHDSVAEVVDKFLMSTDIADLTAGVTEAATAQRTEKEKLPCREPGCKKVFIYRKARETHEEKVHSFVVASMPVVEPASSGLIDHKKQHTEARLSFGFLLFDMLDAVKEGDGERLIRLYKVALLIYKAYGHTNYAYSTFLLTVQINATMSPRVKHDVTWNRFWNSSGGKGKNVPLDLHLEHLNNFLKSFLRNKGTNLAEKTADRVSRSVGLLKTLMDTTDGELQLSRPSGIHHADLKNNILMVLQVLRNTEVFNQQPGRHFSAFPKFNRNILSKLNYNDVWRWMRCRLKDWRTVVL